MMSTTSTSTDDLEYFRDGFSFEMTLVALMHVCSKRRMKRSLLAASLHLHRSVATTGTCATDDLIQKDATSASADALAACSCLF